MFNNDYDWDRKPKGIKKKLISDETFYRIIQILFIVSIPFLMYLQVIMDRWYFNFIMN